MTEEQKVEPEVVEAVPTEEDKPLSIEELQSQIAKLQETSRTFEDNWKNEARSKTKKDQEIQKLREQISTQQTNDDIIKALVATMAQAKGQPADEFEEEVKAKQPDLLKQYEQIASKTKADREKSAYLNSLASVQTRTESLLKPSDDDYDVIRALAEAGKFQAAEKILDRIEQKTNRQRRRKKWKLTKQKLNA